MPGAMRNFCAMHNFGATSNRILHHTNHLCIYRMQSISSYFPNVSTLTLIRCSKEGVYNILKPTIFPNLKQIHYLSLHPGDHVIYKRFPNVSWVFPAKSYTFYDCMVLAGLGRKDPRLISTYIASSKLINKQMEFDLHIPEYGVLDGDIYRAQFTKNIHVPIAIPERIIYNPHHYSLVHHPFQKYYQKKIDKEFFEQLIVDAL
jgi:hypothetical protein